MPARRIVALLLLLTGLGWAQQRAGGLALQAGRGAPDPLSTATLGLMAGLFQQARANLAALPDLAAAQTLAEIASDETEAFPAQGQDDIEQAFDRAHALAMPAPPWDAAAEVRWHVKQDIELRAVTMLSRQGANPEEALALARLADVPRAPLYDVLVEAALRADPDPGDAASTPMSIADGDAPAPTDAVLQRIENLIAECRAADGTYPYRGVSIALRVLKLDELDKLNLIGDAYAWAGNQLDVNQLGQAWMLFQAGHQTAPELDSQLADAIAAVLGHLDRASLDAGVNIAPGLSAHLFEILRQVDPGRASTLAAVYPSLAGPDFSAVAAGPGSTATAPAQPFVTTSSGPSVTFLGGGQAAIAFSRIGSGPAPAFGFTLALPTPSGAGEAVGAVQFRTLLAQAESLRQRDPGQALALANRAAGVLDDALWRMELSQALRLPWLYAQLDDLADASRLLARALQEADREARALDTGFATDSGAQQALIQQDLFAAAPAVADVYTQAARLEMEYTAAHLEAAQFTLLKPMLLAHLALAAQVAARQPAPVR